MLSLPAFIGSIFKLQLVAIENRQNFDKIPIKLIKTQNISYKIKNKKTTDSYKCFY